MPLFVLAELRLGFSRSGYDEMLEELIAASMVIAPDQGTIGHYIFARNAILRSRTAPAKREAQQGLGHDIWIAALCIQHELPLLTNDGDFDGLEGLRIIHW